MTNWIILAAVLAVLFLLLVIAGSPVLILTEVWWGLLVAFLVGLAAGWLAGERRHWAN